VLAVAVAAALVGTTGATGHASTAAGGSPPVPTIAWTPCDDGFECAQVPVPLDYDAPRGATISLALVRLPATDQAHRIGSLFVNPGGPGGSGVEIVLGAGQILSDAVDGRFDIVGFDPRGIAASTPLLCFDSLDDALAILPPFVFPLTPQEVRQQRAADRALGAACRRNAGPIIDHMSTADVVRDLDLLRAAVGDSRLNYLGFSYGTMIGTTYANLFPDRVRALVVDGVLDPIAWTTGRPGQRDLPFSTRLHSDQGAQATLGQFFALCDSAATDTDPATACPFGPGARGRFATLAAQLRRHPVEFPEPGAPPVEVGYDDLIGVTLGAMYSPFVWPDLADLLVALEQAAPAKVAAAREALARALGLAATPAQQPYPNVVEGFPGVACSDSDNPDSYAAWPRAAAAAEARYGYFGRIWTWVSSACQPWPGRAADRYTGPWTARTSNPVLVVGNFFDPATRYQGAQTVSRLLPNSRLLSYAGWGHTAFLGGSTCIDQAVSRYLLTTAVPPAGTVCQPEFDPFAVQAQAASLGASRAAGRLLIDLPASVRSAFGG
jgi:pimeloyl-ACP methyl ester carboxylesterase